MFWGAFCLGLFIGASIGLIVCSLLRMKIMVNRHRRMGKETRE